MRRIVRAIAESVRWRDPEPVRAALRSESALVDRLYAIPDFGVCENFWQRDCRGSRRPRYGLGTADRWCFPCEVVAAIEGDAYDPAEYARHDDYGRPRE